MSTNVTLRELRDLHERSETHFQAARELMGRLFEIQRDLRNIIERLEPGYYRTDEGYARQET